jgi:hypothetical protein
MLCQLSPGCSPRDPSELTATREHRHFSERVVLRCPEVPRASIALPTRTLEKLAAVAPGALVLPDP